MKQTTLRVNGQQHTVTADADTPLLFVLTDELGLRGPRFGCVMPLSAVGADEVTTLEGLGTPEKPHAIQRAFIDEGAAQCGFCLSGVILTIETMKS